MRWLALMPLSLAGALGCSSSGTAAGVDCAGPTGTYELTVSPTGQSENLAGRCSLAAPVLVFDVSFSSGAVSLQGETCALCSTNGCQMNILCGASVTCPSVAAAPDAGAAYLHSVEFILPTGAPDAATANSVVDVGPDYCGYVGTAVRKGP